MIISSHKLISNQIISHRINFSVTIENFCQGKWSEIEFLRKIFRRSLTKNVIGHVTFSISGILISGGFAREQNEHKNSNVSNLFCSGKCSFYKPYFLYKSSITKPIKFINQIWDLLIKQTQICLYTPSTAKLSIPIFLDVSDANGQQIFS